MKVIENYKTGIETSDENVLKEVLAPQVRVDVPAGPSVTHPANTAAYMRPISVAQKFAEVIMQRLQRTK